MIQELLKDKKKIGILMILAIVLIALGSLYAKYGYKELKKNDTESIFVDDSKNTDSSIETSNNNVKKNSSASSKELDITAKEKNIVVEIKGEVNKPDVYTLNENSIVKELIDAAGGLTDKADLTNINRAKKLQNHELIYISNKDDTKKEVKDIKSEVATSDSKGTSNSIININTASLEELKTLTGIGDSKAKSIIEYREKNGGFKSKEEIKNVDGIGDKMFEKIKDKIEV